ncbi:Uncharacterised protein [Klebsiella pneumoniae]|uniref:Uncharacterized protein n=1 Tax=Klebsiella pneumoniae TaxID=573 RepID=A0A4P0Y4D3_KLEPN|nr:Uncharacterised protein [Klebsiella pneumoniae]
MLQMVSAMMLQNIANPTNTTPHTRLRRTGSISVLSFSYDIRQFHVIDITYHIVTTNCSNHQVQINLNYG